MATKLVRFGVLLFWSAFWRPMLFGLSFAGFLFEGTEGQIESADEERFPGFRPQLQGAKRPLSLRKSACVLLCRHVAHTMAGVTRILEDNWF